MVVGAALGALFLQNASSAPSLTDTSDGVLTATIPFSNLTPGTSTTPSSGQIQFRLRTNSNNGYRVLASAVFTVVPTGAAQGGATLTASDIGMGISSMTYGSSVKTPRVDTVASGYNYDPATVPAVNGLTPYTGAASGQATLADLLATPNLTLLAGPRIANNQGTHATNFITVTITFGIVGQFYTPSTLSGTLTLTLVEGP